MRESLSAIKIKTKRRARRVRSKIRGTAAQPRLSVHISNAHFLAQGIDDVNGQTIFAGSDLLLGKTGRQLTVADAQKLGKLTAELARAKGIERVVFDRGARAYHGRVKAFAEGAREGGLQL